MTYIVKHDRPSLIDTKGRDLLTSLRNVDTYNDKSISTALASHMVNLPTSIPEMRWEDVASVIPGAWSKNSRVSL